ncbi:MAG: tRNA(Ile)(2)-agmatinylcytidine synthase [Candidatus Bathyarchaeota archaeon]|nr:tRNA(Ile)(2)-agmatinylcytidine synthase [Candidatus Bathyarchaeota archaeon]
MLLHIGMDDTDSPSGGCTTHIAALLVERLLSLGGRFVEYPHLLRLNPNVPWKTRGNGAVCLRVEIDPGMEGPVKRTALDLVESQSDFECENTNPGVVFHTGEITDSMIDFSERVVSRVVKLEEALRLVDEHGAAAVGYKIMRGIIGALAAVGGLQRGDHTFECLAYRAPENWGRPRSLDADSVRRMGKAMEGFTYNNVDAGSGRVLIAPHGPDPVFFGIRGETPEAVHRAATMVEPRETVERWVIFRSNQGTDAHLRRKVRLSELEPYHPAIVDGEVSGKPRTIQGGHVIFPLSDETGSVDCAAYEPTGGFRDVVRRLLPGDAVRVYGGVRDLGDQMTLNLEKMEVVRLVPDLRQMNPACPECGGSMESMGREKGFRCRRCEHRDARLRKLTVEEERSLGLGLYIPPAKAQRHLTKPLVRYGREKEYVPGELYEPWRWP